MIYFVGLLGMKTCVIIVIYLLPFIVKVGDWALRWTQGNTAVQIIFVMLLFPVIMNAVQYYIIDMFIKKAIPEDKDSVNTLDTALADDDDRQHRSALLADMHDDEDSMDGDETAVSNGGPQRKRSVDHIDRSEETH